MVKVKLIEFKNGSYSVNFPNMGQLQDIEALKISYTNGQYSNMASSGLLSHNFNLDVTDAVSYLSVLIPSLKKDLGIAGWRDLDPHVAKELVKCYKEQFLPWFKPLIDDLYNFNDETPEEESKDE